ncbi:unnamed protein product [Paramecium primaurelia]|uniref:Thioredoxin domain-containing protein n=1 Tax=Paramecium primaurelia TaxID=5886 RepID=A0A8S1QBU4_PARPR|nr:unnamed protein product [Paramecium primaurelia]
MSIKDDTKILQQFLKELPQDIVVKHIKTVKAGSKIENVKSTRVFRSTKQLSALNAQLHNTLKQQSNSLGEEVIQDVKDEINTLIQTLTPKYQVGDKLQQIQGIEKINFGEDNSVTTAQTTFQVEDGIVYLIDIWATWCGPCQGPMEHNQKMLEKNADWQNKVKIVAISVDDDTESVTERVNSKKWKSIEHYRFEKGWDDENDIIKYLQLRGIPFVLLINKWGKIVYLGHPSKGNLEERINKEIALEKEEEQVVNQENQAANNNNQQELLTKEQYQQLKQKIKELQTAIQDAKFEGIVELQIQKENYWNQDGSKQVKQRSKLQLSYDINVAEEEKINTFLQNHWNQISDDLKVVKESKIRDPQRQVKEIKAKFQSYFESKGITIQFPSSQITNLSLSQENQEISAKEKQSISIKCENLTLDAYKTGLEDLREYTEQFEEEENEEIRETIDLIIEGLKSNVTLGEGKQFVTIENYKKWGSEEYTKIEHTQGQVLVVDYWAKWCGPCVREISNNTELIKQNSDKWGNAVRFVSLSLVLADEAKEFMDSHQESQKYIEFYFPKEQRQKDATLYGVQYIPHYIIVDKFGTIRKVAQINDMKTIVNDLINEEAPKKTVEQAEPVLFNQESINKIKGILLSEETKTLIKSIDKQKVITFDLKIDSKQVGEQYQFENAELTYFIRDTQVDSLKEILQKLYQVIPETNWKINKTVSKTVSIKYPGTVCVLCQKDISKDAQQYYSYFKDEHVCTECAEFDDETKQGMERYKYHDTLIFINGPLQDLSVLTNIDDHKLGKNLKLKEGDKADQNHPMMCNGCGGGSKGPRYIAINARPGRYRGGGYIDYCCKCFAELKNKESDKAKEIIAKDAADGMSSDSLFTRVLFNYGGYTAF